MRYKFKMWVVVIFCLLPMAAFGFPVARCVNLANGLEAPFEGAWGYTIRDEDIHAIARDGFDTIRLPVAFSNGYTSGQINPLLLARTDHVIRTALDAGLNVILDLHHFRTLSQDPDRMSPMFVEIWRQLGAHYAGWPDGLMFELINEAHAKLNTRTADALFDKVYPILRARHPDRWIIVSGGEYSHRTTLSRLKRRDIRTAYSFHYYTPFPFTHQGASWVTPKPPERGPLSGAEVVEIQGHFADLARLDIPLLMGEFGVYHDKVSSEDRALWMGVTRRAAERFGIAWCHWGYRSGFRLVDPSGVWLPGLREALMDG